MNEQFNLQAVANGHQNRFFLSNDGKLIHMNNPEGGCMPVVFDSEADAEWFMGLVKDANDIQIDNITPDTVVLPAGQMDADAIPAAVYVITRA